MNLFAAPEEEGEEEEEEEMEEYMNKLEFLFAIYKYLKLFVPPYKWTEYSRCYP